VLNFICMQIQCTQCGGTVNLQEGEKFAICAFCQSALYLDRSKVVFHFVLIPTVTREDAEGKLRRWMAGNETVKDLDVHSVVETAELVYFPMWRFLVNEQDGDQEYSQPASSTSIADIKSIPLSGGDLKFFAPKDFEGITLKEPDVLLEAALQWLQTQQSISKEKVKETNLIHIPFFLFRYQFGGQSYQAIVDAVSGRVLASVFPAKAELPFYGFALASAAIFFVEGMIAPNFLIRIILYIITAVPVGIFSYSIVKKY